MNNGLSTALIASLATMPQTCETEMKPYSISDFLKSDTMPALPEKQPRHTPGYITKPQIGWRNAASLRKHNEIQRRRRRNARR